MATWRLGGRCLLVADESRDADRRQWLAVEWEVIGAMTRMIRRYGEIRRGVPLAMVSAVITGNQGLAMTRSGMNGA